MIESAYLIRSDGRSVRVCPQCSGEMINRPARATFCSSQCCGEYHHLRRKLLPKRPPDPNRPKRPYTRAVRSS